MLSFLLLHFQARPELAYYNSSPTLKSSLPVIFSTPGWRDTTLKNHPSFKLYDDALHSQNGYTSSHRGVGNPLPVGAREEKRGGEGLYGRPVLGV